MGEEWEKGKLWEPKLGYGECLERVVQPLPWPLGDFSLEECPLEDFSLAGCLPLGFLEGRILEGTGEVEVNRGMIFGVAKEHEGKF